MGLDFKGSILEVSSIMEPASTIISKCGGARAVADICGRTTSYVYKWTYPKERSGRDGYVPHEDAEKLLAAARRGEIDIAPEDFFLRPAAELEGKDSAHQR